MVGPVGEGDDAHWYERRRGGDTADDLQTIAGATVFQGDP